VSNLPDAAYIRNLRNTSENERYKMIEAKQTHCGRYKPYGDFFRIWNVQTNLPQDEVVKWCFEKLCHGRVRPIHAEW